MDATGKVGKKLQELGGYVLAGAKDPHQLCTMAEIIRAACDYRYVAIYKIVRGEFVIVAKTGDCPPAYPRFPIDQALPVRRSKRSRPSWSPTSIKTRGICRRLAVPSL